MAQEERVLRALGTGAPGLALLWLACGLMSPELMSKEGHWSSGPLALTQSNYRSAESMVFINITVSLVFSLGQPQKGLGEGLMRERYQNSSQSLVILTGNHDLGKQVLS